MTNKFIKQYNYAEMSVLNVKSIKVTNGENKDNIGGGVNLILPHSGSQKRQNWDEVKWGKMR